jgi:hypothetical protein
MKTIGVSYSLVDSLYFITCNGDVSTTEVLTGVVVQANSRIFRDILFPDFYTPNLIDFLYGVHALVDFMRLPYTVLPTFKYNSNAQNL